MRRILGALAVLAVLALVTFLPACGGDKYTEPFRDGPRSETTNRESSDIIEFPDGFSNWATKCDHGNRIYSAYHGDSAYGAGMISPQDPSCPDGEGSFEG
jgi:hypothetical protein